MNKLYSPISNSYAAFKLLVLAVLFILVAIARN